MVTGPLRMVLWLLGAVAVLWTLFRVGMLFVMAGMMGSGPMMGGAMHSGGMGHGMIGGTHGWGGAVGMMGIMSLQTIGMLGLVGIFIYLIIDSVRTRPRSR